MDNEHALAILGGVSSTVRAIPFFAIHKIEKLKKKDKARKPKKANKAYE